MTTHRILTTLGGAAVVAALALPVGWALAPASATSTPAVASITTVNRQPDQPADQPALPKADRRAERQQRVAERLGVTPEQLRDARIGVLGEDLAKGVAAGRLTQDQSDRLLAAARAGDRREIREIRREIRAARRAAGR